MTKNDSIVTRLLKLTPKEQWAVIYHLIHEQLGDDPERGAALSDDHGQTYLFLVPPHLVESSHDDKEGGRMPRGCSVSSKRFLKILTGGGEPTDIVKRLNEMTHDKRSR
jgi:hypothetical protein